MSKTLLGYSTLKSINIAYVCICLQEICVGMHIIAQLWKSEGNYAKLVSPSMLRWVPEIKLISAGLHREHIYLLSHLVNLVILDFYLLLFLQLQEILKEHIYGHSKQVGMLLRMKWRPSEIVLILCAVPSNN